MTETIFCPLQSQNSGPTFEKPITCTFEEFISTLKGRIEEEQEICSKMNIRRRKPSLTSAPTANTYFNYLKSGDKIQSLTEDAPIGEAFYMMLETAVKRPGSRKTSIEFIPQIRKKSLEKVEKQEIQTECPCFRFPTDFCLICYKSSPVISEEKTKEPFKRQKGDWRCRVCNNINFSRRKFCNKCKNFK